MELVYAVSILCKYQGARGMSATSGHAAHHCVKSRDQALVLEVKILSSWSDTEMMIT